MIGMDLKLCSLNSDKKLMKTFLIQSFPRLKWRAMPFTHLYKLDFTFLKE
jgi:hypothetical protein